MTTNVIEQTETPAERLTLQERARQAAEQAAAAHDADIAGRKARKAQERRDALARELKRTLDIVLPDDADVRVIGDRPVDWDAGDYGAGWPTVVVDGLTFTVRDLYGGREYSDQNRLHVLVPCARSCGNPVAVGTITSLLDLNRALSEPRQHDDCLVEYDEDGEPTTDRDGNPLPPKRPPQKTPEQTAQELVTDAYVVGSDLAQIVRSEHDAIVRRDRIFTAAVAQLLGTVNPLTPGKNYTQTAAEAAAKQREDYQAAQRDRIALEAERIEFETRLECAKLTAKLAVRTIAGND